ncbi:hypothetical protein ElyMa_000578500 [Elysia marginata]|uniref:Uncharacterized protein n=1 Tax=Elysia marginata TaxID=1093978 RepID=A0AAV4G558_9GAST|nr:hypothetical protein ElyMa_000578500 [Elysia marginata]
MTLNGPPDADTGTSALYGRAADMRQSTLQSTLPGALDGSFPSSYGVNHSDLTRPVGPLVGPPSCLHALLLSSVPLLCRRISIPRKLRRR